MPADIPSDETWLETEIDAEDAVGPAAAKLLQSVEHTLRGAPEDRRYDVEVTVRERVIDDE